MPTAINQPTDTRSYDVIVIGAGAAGLMCAAVAGQRGRRVALLDHNAAPGRKILISGGGRCNFTNIHCAPDRFLSANPHFAKSALALYQPQHFIELVNSYQIRWHEKTLGQLFCDGSAHAILNMLLAECEKASRAGGKVDLILQARDISIERAASPFTLTCSQGTVEAGALVIATGGLSIPKLGATGFAYQVAQQFNIPIVEPRPALVPLVLTGPESAWTALSGVSAEVIAQAGKARFREKILFTHRGLSGPAILQASSYWHAGKSLTIDFSPATKLLSALLAAGGRRDDATFRNALRSQLPQRMADHITEIASPKSWTNHVLDEAEHELHQWKFHPSGTEGFEKAEVTAGGIDTNSLHARTMEARTVPGLFFIGEAVDVTGHLGGFNFQWAWASAVAAARAL